MSDRMPRVARTSAVPNVLIVNDDPDAAADLRALLQLEGVSAHVLTVDAFGAPDAAATWMLQLDPIAIVIDIVATAGNESWSRLTGLQDAAAGQHVPFVMTTRSRKALDAPVDTNSVIEVADHDGRERLAACIAGMVVPTRPARSGQ